MTVDDLDEAPDDVFLATMAPLFEGAPRFLRRLAAARPFGSEEALFARALAVARAMPEGEQIELVDAHPRLGAPRGSVSARSFVEQGYDREAAEAAADAAAEASADAAAEAERSRVDEELALLNDRYEQRFGFRFCVFVAGRSRAALVPVLDRALTARRDAELRRALADVVEIARDRYRKATAPEGVT